MTPPFACGIPDRWRSCGVHLRPRRQPHSSWPLHAVQHVSKSKFACRHNFTRAAQLKCTVRIERPLISVGARDSVARSLAELLIRVVAAHRQHGLAHSHGAGTCPPCMCSRGLAITGGTAAAERNTYLERHDLQCPPHAYEHP